MEEGSEKRSSGSPAIWTLVIVLMIVGMILYSGYKDKRYLRSHPEYRTGIITGKFEEARGEQYVSYTFVVDTTTYAGRMPIKFCLECHDSCCVTGGKVKVRYAEGNPSNNELVH